MVVVSSSLRFAYEFACHSKACAPPPAGTGGSNPGIAARDAVRARNARNAQHHRDRTGPFTRSDKPVTEGASRLIGDLTKTGFAARGDMPQFTGVPRAGSDAAKLPRTDHGTVHAMDAFTSYVKATGVKVYTGNSPANLFKASQTELDPVRVMSAAASSSKAPILVSKDGYVIDGHHRWAGQMVKNPNGTLDVIRIGLPIRTALKVANDWTRKFGLESKSA